MKFLTLLLIPLLWLMTSCTIDWNDEKEIESVNWKTVEIEKKCEVNNDWDKLNECYESVTYCDQNNICVAPMLPIACWKDFSQHLDLRCECKIENGVAYSRIACKIK